MLQYGDPPNDRDTFDPEEGQPEEVVVINGGRYYRYTGFWYNAGFPAARHPVGGPRKMRWPWSSQDKGRGGPAVAGRSPIAVIQAIVAQADGSSAGDPPNAIAALETAANLYARAISAAKVTPMTTMTKAITPAFLALVTRNLIRRGESLHLIEVRHGGLHLAQCGSWDVRGDDDPETWVVRGDLFGPSGNRTVFRPWSSFIHCMYAVDPARPWYGVGPLGWARDTSALAANLEARPLSGSLWARGSPTPSSGRWR